MTNTESMSIGVFAKHAGLTASALRFYDDAGLLPPEWVDPSTGYRFYGEAQLCRASWLRQLREIGMPLTVIARFLTAEPAEAERLLDEQVAKVVTDAAAVQHTAAALRTALGKPPRRTVCVLPGPVFADAVDQVLATTLQDPAMPVLGGVRMEATPESVALTATDRYRLASRTLVPTRSSADSWTGTLDGDELRILAPRLRRSPTVSLEVDERSLGHRLADGAVRDCRLLAEFFPDYRLMIESLPAVSHRVTVGKQETVRVLERCASEHVGIRIFDRRPGLVLSDGTEVDIAGAANGNDLTFWFELTTLYPALTHAVGADLMFELRGPDQPATIRSADGGDLTTLVMPCRAPDTAR
ncbi:DNA-binding transcriptional regulator, MerR family [Actinopolyspora mzabensis]|uniref:DNA-binding transcriptional regulator, MerR family n=1 Tax=Actinopolyspora mzabensis TaxID=995066 RepID=A0A1G8VWN0_ACTMZ|nr:MerR family transcriptional regulator [Actinopolyspora mzabensis]SDJ70227.1 DNA-binding transcriptional regulator, MerR family [Actinopolyspora mzabensis]